MEPIDQVIREPEPSTVNYRFAMNRRETMNNLIDGGTSIKHLLTKQVSSKSCEAIKLNWLNGVFIPVLLNVWGVIMFLRLGWVVGQAGLLLGSLIIITAEIVTGITALSLCAICTNGEVKGGGVYFLISRALGPVYGGTIGILFFVAQAVAVSLYVVGFAEAVTDLIFEEKASYLTGDEINDIRLIGLITSIVLFLVSLIGIGWYAKTQTGLLVILVISISSVFIGAFFPQVPDMTQNLERGFLGFRGLSDTEQIRNLKPNFQVDPDAPSVTQDFFTVFAVFFPAVTGIMAGANLSGDLDDASKAIPKGTLSAIVLTFFSYILLLWIIGLVCAPCADFEGENIILLNVGCNFNKLTSDMLADGNFIRPTAGLLYDRLIIKHVSLWSYLVYIGVFAATLSSALASLIGAPRILQSVAQDKLFPFKWFNFFAAGRGPGKEPIRGYCLTFAITCGCVSIGKLDLIAPIITNFFLISYALTNYACFASSNSQAPNWRPSFKYYHKNLSLLGAFMCILVMIAIDWLPALVTIIFVLLVMLYLKTLNPDINWGEAGEAKKYRIALDAMETLQQTEKTHVKTFRPSFLVMTGNVFERMWLVKFVSFLQSGGAGLLICADVMCSHNLESIDPNANSLDVENVQDSASHTIGSNAETVNNLFSSNVNLEFDGTNNENVDQSSMAAKTYSIETAKQLACEYEFVQGRRIYADAFLNSKVVWGSKRCKGAFFDAVISNTLFSGFQKTLQLSGLGRMRPNTVVVGFKKDYRRRPLSEIADYERLLRAALAVGQGLLVVRDDNLVFDLNLSKSVSFNTSTRPGVTTDVEAGLFGEDFKPEKPEFHKLANGILRKSPGYNERVEKYKMNDIEYMTRFENSLPTRIKGNYIDVWWLADDGGLTMLLPHLLIKNSFFKGKQLRVMVVSKESNESKDTGAVTEAEIKMIHLLHKFRIKALTVGIKLNLDTEVAEKTKQRFKKCMGIGINELSLMEKQRTIYKLRLSEEIRKHSKESSVVFIIIPIPERVLTVKLHTVWLDMLSHDMPPTVMMRGNNKNVLTFFC